MTSTTQTNNKKSSRCFIGLLFVILGGLLIDVFAVRQLRENGGHTYFGFIVLGVMFAITGLIIIRRSRRLL